MVISEEAMASTGGKLKKILHELKGFFWFVFFLTESVSDALAPHQQGGQLPPSGPALRPSVALMSVSSLAVLPFFSYFCTSGIILH